MENAPATPDNKALKDALNSATKGEKHLPNLPLKYAEVVRSEISYLDAEKRGEAVGLIREWVAYAQKHGVTETDTFSVRYHLSKFAEEAFGKHREHIPLEKVPIGTVTHEGASYEETIAPYVSPEIVRDPNVAVIGGTARLALKMYAGVPIDEELPLSDIDIVASTNADIPETAKKYHVELAGTKVIDQVTEKSLSDLITNFDCTMNQAAVHNGELFFPERALQDVKEGNIRLVAKDDPLFGSEGVVLPDGNVYLNRNGFYRGLSFLLRGKGKRLIVSKENIELEKNNIGRYWLVMLFVKIMPMQNKEACRDAIAHWHEIAHRMGATQTENPEAFLHELMEKYPETKMYSSAAGSFDINAQVKWLIGKLTSRAVDRVLGEETTILPETYTEANLELSDTTPPYDFESFARAVADISKVR